MSHALAPGFRNLCALLPALAFLLVPFTEPNPAAIVVGAAITVLALSAIATQATRRDLLSMFTGRAYGPERVERCLRSSFRRQTSPDAPGRPLPRAPGTALRLA